MAAYSTYSDRELVALMKQDDDAVFEEVFLRYEPLLLQLPV